MTVSSGERFCIVGGAGFIGSHFTDNLLTDPSTAVVTLYDNFSSGQRWYSEHHAADKRLKIVEGDVGDLPKLTEALKGHDTVIHLASNPDIARAVREPDIDFYQGTQLTQNVIEAMRRASVKNILYASGSGVYGDLGTTEAHEDWGPMEPVSTYGASKLAGEAMIAAYCHMFDMRGRAFRFGNVIGARQTHGVGLDFLKRLRADGTRLRILGDGYQSKAYVHVSDIVNAVLHVHRNTKDLYQVYNVATPDYITVRDIAALAIEVAGLKPDSVTFDFTGGDRGWKGDVPIVRLNSDRIRATGWVCRHVVRESMRRALTEMWPDVCAGRL